MFLLHTEGTRCVTVVSRQSTSALCCIQLQQKVDTETELIEYYLGYYIVSWRRRNDAKCRTVCTFKRNVLTYIRLKIKGISSAQYIGQWSLNCKCTSSNPSWTWNCYQFPNPKKIAGLESANHTECCREKNPVPPDCEFSEQTLSGQILCNM